jgi:hypothetical protein
MAGKTRRTKKELAQMKKKVDTKNTRQREVRKMSEKNADQKAIDNSTLIDLIKKLSTAGGVPISLQQAEAVRVDTASRLNVKPRVSTAFPPCPEELVALIKTTAVPQQEKDDVTLYFDEYFKFGSHAVLIEDSKKPGGSLADHLDSELLKCLAPSPVITSRGARAAGATPWPTDCCFCPSCVTLDGNRNPPPSPLTTLPALKRLFIGDLVWLFYLERMGIFKMLGVLLDSFATKGDFPISNGALNQPPGIKDDIVALVLEACVRLTKMGLSSTVRDRDSSYRRCLGWTSDVGRKTGLEVLVNTGFNIEFQRFISQACEFYKDRRLAVAIRGTTSPIAPPSVATLRTIRDTIDVLKKRFETFDYGRNYQNTLGGIVWVIASMSLIRELREVIGIPPVYDKPHEYIPAAYATLVMKGKATTGESNRYTVHAECARNGRDILLDLEVINYEDALPGGELERWLDQVEAKIEGYRTAYRTLTGIDLGAPGTSAIEQQV